MKKNQIRQCKNKKTKGEEEKKNEKGGQSNEKGGDEKIKTSPRQYLEHRPGRNYDEKK